MRAPMVLAALAVPAAGCGGGGGYESVELGMTVRDSAGVVIIEHHASVAPARWHLSSAPVAMVPQELPAEQLALDPVAVFDGPSGAIGVGDGNQVGWHSVFLYEPTGALRVRIGGGGRGPGEFGGQLWWADLYRGDSIIAWDRRGPAGPSIKVYGADAGYSRDVTIPQPPRPRPEGTRGFSAGAHGWFRDGDFLTSSGGYVAPPQQPGPVRYQHLLLSVDPDGAAWDTIGEFGLAETHWSGSEQGGYWFGAPGIVRTLGDRLLLATEREYEFRVLSRAGVPELIVRRDIPAESVEPGDIAQVVDLFVASMAGQPGMSEDDVRQMRRRIEATPTAPTKPAFSNVVVDDELRIWVERFRWLDAWGVPLDPEPSEWDVFSPAGEWVATVDVPARVLIASVSGNQVFGIRVDEADVKHVEVYDIEVES